MNTEGRDGAERAHKGSFRILSLDVLGQMGKNYAKLEGTPAKVSPSLFWFSWSPGTLWTMKLLARKPERKHLGTMAHGAGRDLKR